MADGIHHYKNGEYRLVHIDNVKAIFKGKIGTRNKEGEYIFIETGETGKDIVQRR